MYRSIKSNLLLAGIAMGAIVGFYACSPQNANTEQENEQTEEIMQINDPHSFANMNQVRVNHLNLDLAVDFNTKTLTGWAQWDLNFLDENTSEVVLDTRQLTIAKVEVDGNEIDNFSLKEPKDIFGSALHIPVTSTNKTVKIYYTTSPDAEALQWLSSEQTHDKKHPFLFSQSQAILARTWIPCMDGPGIKFSYDATIRTEPQYLALMSAENGTQPTADGVQKFKMPQPVSSYLMALSVGVLDFQKIGRNSGVYAEPGYIEECAWELEDMQSMIDSAEELYGDYRWGQYDVLVLPPSFPFGGMENPRLTFATPTIIAGDRSLVALIAHELAHSWSGNLVTNATWNDFWLNEGFTVYFENRIMEKIYGKNYADMLKKLGQGEVKHTVHRFTSEGKEEDTHLYLEMEGRNPDDGVSDIAYEKGRFFLETIEQKVGREKFDAFLKNYFTTHAFQSMTTTTFIDYLGENLFADNANWKDELQVNAWIYGPGLPENMIEVKSTELENVDAERTAWENGDKQAANIDTTNWTTHHWLYFLRGLNSENLTVEKIANLDAAHKLTQSGNSEILCDWFKHAIDHNYQAAYPALDKFLVNVGRRKFLTPLYERLASTPEGKAWALKVYEKARPGYHAVSYNTIDDVLGYNASVSAE